MKNKVAFFWKDLPTWSKGVIAVAGLGITYFAARGIWKAVKSKIDLAKENKVSAEAGVEVKKLAQKGVRPTLNNAQLESMCAKLVEAFDGCGTTESAVYEVMKGIKNDADIYALIDVYGVRKYDGCNWEFDFGNSEFNLPRAIQSELDFIEISQVNKILAANNVNYKF